MKTAKHIYRIFITLFFITIVFFAIRECGFYKNLKSDSKETIAIIIEIKRGYKFHEYYRYTFTVNGRNYYNSAEISEETKEIRVGHKYIVIYWPEDPQVSRLKRDERNFLVPAK